LFSASFSLTPSVIAPIFAAPIDGGDHAMQTVIATAEMDEPLGAAEKAMGVKAGAGYRAVPGRGLTAAVGARRLIAVLDLLNQWLDRARQRRMLAGLDSRALADIGCARADAWAESSKPFWRE